jgi:hypothetical protein
MTEYAIGTQYLTRNREPRLCTVVDVWKTFNAAGELVEVSYVAEHVFMGQRLTERDVCATTIAMGLVTSRPDCEHVADMRTFADGNRECSKCGAPVKLIGRRLVAA